MFNPARFGTCRDRICEMFYSREVGDSCSASLERLQETISKRSATLKKPVPAENLYRSRFKLGYYWRNKSES